MPELTYRYRLYPTKQQEIDILRTCACARQLYNMLLEDRTQHYRQTGRWNKIDRNKYSAMPYMLNVDPMAMAWAQKSLMTAYRNFFHVLRTKQDRYRPESKLKAEQDPEYVLMDTDLMSYPRVKKKRTTKESYTTYLKDLTVENNRIVLPCVGKVKIRYHRPLPADAQQICTTILKKSGGDFYLLVQLKLPDVEEKRDLKNPLGVVFVPGVPAVRSDEIPVEFRHVDEGQKRRIDKTYQALKRRTPGSHRYEKLRKRLAGLYEHRVNQRRDDLHKAARMIADAGDAIYLQRPDVTKKISRLSDPKDRERQLDEAWRTFYDMVRYKTFGNGKRFWAVPRAFPVYSICSDCGCKIGQKEKENMICPDCGTQMNRHLNAACNLRNLGEKYIQEQMK